jgi:hypothetical protein
VADANLVAIVGIGAGALVALGGPAITARATTRGQRRLFAHQRHLDDRRELRSLLDQTIETIAEVERRLAALHLAHVAGEFAGVVEGPLGRSGEAVRQLELLCIRVAIRLGEDAPAYRDCKEVATHAEAVVSAIDRHITLPDVYPEPSSRALLGEIDGIHDATSRFAAAAKAVVGFELIEAEQTTERPD